MMQHLYVINTTCTSIPNIFNAANNCFLKQRATPLFSTACPSVFTQYTTRLKNMVGFSYIAGEYSDSFMQNLRNYLGVYLTISTNMSSFYLSTNVTNMVGAIATNATNVSNLSSCSYPSLKVDEVRNAYCENVLPSMFQVFVICFGGLACMFLLTVLVHVAEYPLDHIIASARISVDPKSKIRMDSSMNLEGDAPQGFDLNMMENEPAAAQKLPYQNIFMDSSHNRNDEPLNSSIIENNKSGNDRNDRLAEIKSADQERRHINQQDNLSGNRENSIHGTPIRNMEGEQSSGNRSVKQAES